MFKNGHQTKFRYNIEKARMFRKDSDLRNPEEPSNPEIKATNKWGWILAGAILGNMVCFIVMPNLRTLDFVFSTSSGSMIAILWYAHNRA